MENNEELKQSPVEEAVEEVETVETPAETTEEVQADPFEEKYNAEHDAYLRLAAEYDNFRKRTAKEKDASYGNGKSDAVGKMLPSMTIWNGL